MEVRVPRDILTYEERLFFGLSVRQFFSVIAAVLSAVAAWFLLRNRLGTEAVSWVCMFCSLPCILYGFVRIQGMYFESFLRAFAESQLLFPAVLICRCENAWYESVQRRRTGEIPPLKEENGPAPRQEPKKRLPKQRDRFELYQSPNLYRFRKRRIPHN